MSALLAHESAQSAFAAGSALPDDARLASAQFRAFFAELDKARATAMGATDEASSVAAKLSERLVQVIEMQTLEAQRLMGLGGQVLESRARFLKAALADEVMLHHDWSGRVAWRDHLVEGRLFGSSMAGQKVIQDVEDLLAQRDPRDRAAALLHLHVLCLGFQGRLRGTPQALAENERYRAGLFRLVYQRAPDLVASAPHLGAAAYDQVLSQRPQTRMPRLTRRWVIFTTVMVGLLAFSEVAWLWQTWPLRQALSRKAEAGQAARPATPVAAATPVEGR